MILSDFIEYVDCLFPSVSESVKNKAKECVDQFRETNSTINYLMSEPLSELSQGDIISNIPFCVFVTDTGELRRFLSPGMVISTSCDIDNHDFISIVPLYSIHQYGGNKEAILSNECLQYMYLPDTKVEDYFIDFGIICSYEKDLIIGSINSGRTVRMASLSQIGYYFLICKLSAFLLRREDTITKYKRVQEIETRLN